MGFVNILTVRSIAINLSISPSNSGNTSLITGAKKEKPIASLSDIPDSEDIELPYIILNTPAKQAETNKGKPQQKKSLKKSKISVEVSSILIYCCHDSLWSLYLLSSCASCHFGKMAKEMTKKMQKPKPTKLSHKKFEEVIKEANDSSESDEEIGASALAHGLQKITITERNDPQEHLTLEQSIVQDFDIIKDKHKEEFEEGEVKMWGHLDISTDYIGSSQSKEPRSQDSKQWHKLTDPKSEIMSGVVVDDRFDVLQDFELVIQ